MQVLEALGYSQSKRFYRPTQVDDLPASELTFALRLAALECPKLGGDGVRFEGAYVLQREPNDPAVPVVYVVRADTDAVARRVHQFVWNQNQAPFLLLESPTTIRVYPGFTFKHGTNHPLVTAARVAADALEKLADFRAESIDDGTLWKHRAGAVDPARRVDESLLRDLEALDKRLQKDGLDRRASHGLIGKFVYLKYLRDRHILSDKKLAKWRIDPKHLFTRSATLKTVHKVDDELQKWLNGSVFSLGEVELSDTSPAQLQLVAEVFRGGSPSGGEDLQATLFEAYDFAHIPIETLSSVYELFLHDTRDEDGRSRGKSLGAYYTPLPLADYLLSEMEQHRPLAPGMKVLDPACGSGTLLVQSYRRLIEKQRREKGRDLKKSELRDLLTEHIFGIDRDEDACRIAELSLILTLLDYVDPPDLEDTTFKLPRLRNQNIFGPSEDSQGNRVSADFFDTSGPVHDFLAKERFDWIVGNPPWAEVKGTPPPEHEHYVVHQWMKANKATFPTSGNQIAEAFLWKTGQHLAPEGKCGLVVLAMTWFKKEGTAFRKRFFAERRVWSLANFANLAEVLFSRKGAQATLRRAKPRRAASVVFFDCEEPSEDHVILTFAPFVAEQVANRPEKPNTRQVTWNIIVSANEVRDVANDSAKLGDSLTWKLAMWGTARDRKLLYRLDARFKNDKFGSLNRLGITTLHQGLELRASTSKEPVEHHPELEGTTLLLIKKLKQSGPIFAFPPSALRVIHAEECFVRKGRARLPIKVSSPPHIIVDASRRFAVFSDDFITVPSRQVGVAGDESGKTALRALSLYFSSDFFRYHQFFLSPQWGVDASRVDLETLKSAPMPLSRLSSEELNEWAQLHGELATLSRRQFDDELDKRGRTQFSSLLIEVNERVYKLLGLRPADRWLIEDFLRHHLKLNQGKVARDAMRSPLPTEQGVYLQSLQHCLDAFLSPERGLKHKIEVLADSQSALLSVSLVRSTTRLDPSILNADQPTSRDLKTIRDRLRSQHSQWIYFDRALKVYDRQCGALYQFKPMQRLHWTRRQAVLDADDIIAETLVEGGVG